MGRHNIQLYDLDSDPHETRNCLNDENKQEIASELRDRLIDYIREKKSYSFPVSD
jgi:hypothetical protein